MRRAMELPSRERPLSEANLLLREYSHRINNEYASAISVISCAAARCRTDEAKRTLSAVRDQLLNYALVHHSLQMPEHNIRIDAAAYLGQLCRAISRSKLDSRHIELSLVAQKCWMNSERCWRLGLIVSELITNSVRHGLSEHGGAICVELLASTPLVTCRIADNGMSEPEIRPGRGLQIIAALASSLGGTITHDFGPQGATSVLVFPAADDLPGAGRKTTRAIKSKKRENLNDRERIVRLNGECHSAVEQTACQGIR